MGQVSLLALLRKMFSIFGRLQSIPYTNPEVTPANWCAIQPCKQVRIGTREIILTQPSSTFLVYSYVQNSSQKRIDSLAVLPLK